MARYDISNQDCGSLGAVASGAVYFQLGLMYAIGRGAPIDRVSAHKWFNLASREGVEDASRMRRELALEMSREEIADAQRLAREHLQAH